jgi:hypothetical protein
MNATLDPVSRSTLCALLDLLDNVEQSYNRASEQLSLPGPRALVGFLAIQHAEHLEDFSKHAAACGVSPSRSTRDDPTAADAWEELRSAMASDKRDVVVAACQLTERLVLRAYELAATKLAAHRRTLELVKRHTRDLEAIQTFVRTICSEDISWQSDDEANASPLADGSRNVLGTAPSSATSALQSAASRFPWRSKIAG